LLLCVTCTTDSASQQHSELVRWKQRGE